MTLYEAVRKALAEHGGTCHQGLLHSSLLANPDTAKQLAKSQGFPRLLDNMKHSGFIEIDGEMVRRTKRRVGRRRV